MANQPPAESIESVAKFRQLELLFEMKEQLDLVYRQLNHFRKVCKSVDRLNRAVSKIPMFVDRSPLSIEYWKFKRTYSRILKRKIRQIDRKMFDVNLYDKLYDLYESLIIIDECEEPITVMEGDDNDNDDDHDTIGMGPDANLASSDNAKDLNFDIISEPLETFEIPTEIPRSLIDDCQNSNLDSDDSEMNLDPELFRCNRNGCVFSTKHQQYFDDHLQVHNSELYCDQCDKSFKLASNLTAHKKTHERIKQPRFKCGWMGCHYSTNRADHFKSHQAVHSEERPFRCTQCDKSFKLAFNLTAHKKTHERIKQPRFKCGWMGCHYSTNRPDHFKSHQAVHSDERPFRCAQCDKSFKLASNLTAHKKTHERIKQPRFQCSWEGCKFSTDRSDSLNDHLTIHTDELQNRRSRCGQSFRTLTSLSHHKRRHRKRDLKLQKKRTK